MQLGGLGALQRWELELKVIRGSPGGKIQWGCNRGDPGCCNGGGAEGEDDTEEPWGEAATEAPRGAAATGGPGVRLNYWGDRE